MDLIILQKLGVALLLASLIGLERERRYQLYDFDNAFGGIRTFALIGVMGALAYIFSGEGYVLFAVFTTGFLALLIAAYVLSSKGAEHTGATSEMAAILVYMVGVLAGMGELVVATSVALGVLMILHFKDPLHKWAKQIKNKEIVSTIEFAIIAFVILPILPNQHFGPYGFFNPYVLWLLVVFISGLSFVSYIAVKVWGARRGIALTGFLGGLVSSTAVTLSFSHESKKNKTISNPYVVAVVVASSAMFFRVLVEVAVVNSELLASLLLPMLSMGLVGVVASFFFLVKKREESKLKKKVVEDVRSPFNLMPALKFGVFFAFILFLSNYSLETFGNSGLYLTSVLSGVVDVDAITLSMASLAKTSISDSAAVNSITIAAMVNTFAKGVIFMIFGRREVAMKIGGVFLLMLVAGGVSLLFV